MPVFPLLQGPAAAVSEGVQAFGAVQGEQDVVSPTYVEVTAQLSVLVYARDDMFHAGASLFNGLLALGGDPFVDGGRGLHRRHERGEAAVDLGAVFDDQGEGEMGVVGADCFLVPCLFRHGPLHVAGRRVVDGGEQQVGLAAKYHLDGLQRHPGALGDGFERRTGVALRAKQGVGRLHDFCAGGE